MCALSCSAERKQKTPEKVKILIKKMTSNIRINLLREKPKYSSNIGENEFRIYTPGEVITEQKDFMRLI